MLWKRVHRPVVTDQARIGDLLTRGVEDVFVKENLETKLRSGRRLRVKLGIDPTGKTIHIGRAITLWKLKAFQDLGHQVVLIVGDFTAQIGDPSDKLEKRPMLTTDVIRKNLADYKKIIGKILDVNKAEFLYNSTWLSKIGFKEISDLAESFSVQQMSNRRNFKERFERGEEVSLREFLYPLMQGYDSVAVRADVELGGFDQLFNLKAGRVIQKHYGQPEQDIITFEMLPGTDGRKMSTSWGNVITITDEPNDMYGKIMSLHDDLIEKYFFLCTHRTEEEIKQYVGSMKAGANPRDIKKMLAHDIVALYHGEALAHKAEEWFTKVFSRGQIPDSKDLHSVTRPQETLLVDILLQEKIVESKSEFARLCGEGAVTVNDEKIKDLKFVLRGDIIVRVGKRRILRIESV